MNLVDISIIIPYIHEFPALIHTVFAIQNEFIDLPYSYEIIVVENSEKDVYTDKFLHYMRALQAQGRLRYFFEPRQCGPIARNTGAKNAAGKYLIFTDAHVQFAKNTIPMLVEAFEKTPGAGMIHGSTVWSHYNLQNAGCHYKLFGGAGPSLTSHFHGTYNRANGRTSLYRVGGATQAYVIYPRELFLKMHGYNEACRFYPHPENYTCLKFQMFGYQCWLEPNATHFHSLYPRNYGKPPEDYCAHDHTIENAMICAYTLGGDPWLQRVEKEWIRRGGKPERLTELSAQAKEKTEEEYQWVKANAKYSLDEVLLTLKKQDVAGMEDYQEGM